MTSRTAQKAAISAKTGPVPARGRGRKVGKGSATTPLGDEPIPLDDEDELQDENIENTQTETKNVKGRKKPTVKAAKCKAKQPDLGSGESVEEIMQPNVASAQKDSADLHKNVTDSKSDDKKDAQPKPVRKDTDKPKGDKHKNSGKSKDSDKPKGDVNTDEKDKKNDA